MPESKYEKIVWVDARSDDGWTVPEDIDVRLALITTVGLIVHDTKDVLCVASSEDSRTGQFSGIMYIPQPCIVNRWPMSTPLDG